MKKSDRAKKQTAKVIEAAARAHEALDYFNGNVTNPFDELTWPSIAEGYLLVAQKAVSDALVALERANSVGWTKNRSEERRVGQECVVRVDHGGGGSIKKKKTK